MTSSQNNPPLNEAELRVLLLLPTGRDAALVSQTLAHADLCPTICADFATLESQMSAGVGVILLAEEALQPATFQRFVELIEQQPVWSDVPVVLLAAERKNHDKLLAGIGTRVNITIVERPLPQAILISAVRGALRARKKQYQMRDVLAQLKEADHQKDLFLATLSHELRTPLNAMTGWIELLKSGHNGFDRRHALEVIERNAKAQAQIVNDILLLSRVVTGKFAIEPKPISLALVVQAALDVVQPLLEAKEINLVSSFDAAADDVQGDFDRLQQVFWNLLANAVKFTPPHGRISVTTQRAGKFAAVQISDDGQGISADFLPVMFEKFRQADGSYTRSAGGLGLGLAIVRSIVDQHGGQVTATSEGAGRGATFLVKLPLAAVPVEAAVAPAKIAAKEGEYSFAGLRVLIAEDDPDSREMLCLVLNQYEIETEAVATAAAALDALRTTKPQLFISDVGMPDMDGFALLRQIRRLPPEQGGQVPAIALTGYASSQDRAQSLASGYQAHLTKPLDFDQLFETIKTVMSRPAPKPALARRKAQKK